MKRQTLRAISCIIALGMAGVLRAADPAPISSPQPVLRLSIQSADTAARLAAELGLPLPDPAGQIESSLAILAPGSIAKNKPLGVVMLASDALPGFDSPQAVVFALPIVEGKMSVADFLAAGRASPNPTVPGVLSLGSLNLKRTQNYLFLESGNAPVLTPVGDNAFAADYLEKTTLACFSLDLATLRRAAPEGYKRYLDTVTRNSTAQQTPGTPANVAGQRMGQQFALDMFNRLEKLDVAISEEDDSLRLKTWIAPYSGNPVPQQMPRPRFPAGTIATLHITYPDADAASWCSKLVDWAVTASAAELSPAEVDAAKTAIGHAARLYTGGQALSLAFATEAKQPLLYLVSQSAKPVDYPAEAALLVKEWQAVEGTQKNADHIQLSSYHAAGKTISRLTFTNRTSGALYLDGLSNGTMLFVTISADPRHFVPDLAAAGADGKSSLLCSGSIDLAAALAGAAKSPLAPLTADLLEKAFAGQTISWTVQPSDHAGHSLCIDVKVPKQAIKGLIALATSRPATPPVGNP